MATLVVATDGVYIGVEEEEVVGDVVVDLTVVSQIGLAAVAAQAVGVVAEAEGRVVFAGVVVVAIVEELEADREVVGENVAGVQRAAAVVVVVVEAGCVVGAAVAPGNDVVVAGAVVEETTTSAAAEAQS